MINDVCKFSIFNVDNESIIISRNIISYNFDGGSQDHFNDPPLLLTSPTITLINTITSTPTSTLINPSIHPSTLTLTLTLTLILLSLSLSLLQLYIFPLQLYPLQLYPLYSTSTSTSNFINFTNSLLLFFYLFIKDINYQFYKLYN